MRKSRDNLKSPQHELRIFRVRALLAVVLVFSLTGLLMGRLAYLQVVQHEVYTTRSEKNRVRVEPLPPTRGLIYDRNGVLLAENRPTYNLTLVRERVDDLDATLAVLVGLLELPEEEAEAFRIRSRQRQRPFQPALLMSDLNEDQIARLAVNRHLLPGVEVEAQLLRYYPDAEVMAHALGYVGRINAEEMATLDTGRYAGTHFIGKTGVERFYEDALHGQAGLRKVETNARGRVLRELGRTDPVPGQNVTLTLDKELQKLAYELLDGRRGSIVAIAPQTGEILAMVSAPGFDSNQFVTGIDVASYRALQENLDLPLYNRAIRGHYPPGSTIKPFLALAGLAEGVITPERTINDPGFYQLPNDTRRYRNWLRWGHGRVDMERSIAVSNNTYYYSLAHEMGIDRLHENMSAFGFGQRVGHDVFGESTALMPSRDWKRGRFNQPWYPGETLSVGIGQGYWQVTPLQLATATAVLANRGEWVKPRLASRIGDEPVPSRVPETPEDIEISLRRLVGPGLLRHGEGAQRPRGHGSTHRGRARVPPGRQVRHRPGLLAGPGPALQRRGAGRAAARPRAVHGLRPHRGSPDRRVGDRRERRRRQHPCRPPGPGHDRRLAAQPTASRTWRSCVRQWRTTMAAWRGTESWA
jgi:penicillin-binding protein 2